MEETPENQPSPSNSPSAELGAGAPVRAKKRLGQHFLKSDRAVLEIIEAAELSSCKTVLEIGPGMGILTTPLLKAGKRVVAVEKDDESIEYLKREYREAVNTSALTLISGDIRDADWMAAIPKAESYCLVANIPYYITGDILRRFLSHEQQPVSMTLLVQKEVAERIAKSVKSSILSLSVRAYGEPRYVATVPKGAFAPAPKVDSAILHISGISRERFANIPEEAFFALVKTGFKSKRKQLINNLQETYTKDAVLAAFAELSIPEKARAEDLALDAWFALAGKLS